MKVGDVVKIRKYGKVKMTVTDTYAAIITTVYSPKKRDGSYSGNLITRKFCIMQLKVCQ